VSRERLLRIIELARWAPSGDNTQPWRFEILADDLLVVHGSDTRDHCIYDIEGHPSQIAIGALIENIAIAASAESLEAGIQIRPGGDDRHPRIEIRFSERADICADPLVQCILRRSVQRRPLSRRPLSDSAQRALESSLGPSYGVRWFTGSTRSRVAQLLWGSAHLRLTIPEAYAVHREIIAWRSQFSDDRVPDQAIGLDPMGTRLMAWAMQSWDRVHFLNTYLGGTLLPRFQLDLLPGLFCAAHFAIVANEAPQDLAGYIAAGRAVQRFWLTGTQANLQLQPEMTPLIFSAYARRGAAFSVRTGAMQEAQSIEQRFSRLLGANVVPNTVFFGRVGYGKQPTARSTRLPVEQLLIESR